jgi:hypothetical protein
MRRVLAAVARFIVARAMPHAVDHARFVLWFMRNETFRIRHRVGDRIKPVSEAIGIRSA